MTDPNELRKQFLTGTAAITGPVAAEYFEDLEAQIIHDADPLPRTVLTGASPNGRPIYIIEGCCLAVNGPVQRGFMYFAVMGRSFTLLPSIIMGNAVIPSRIMGGAVLATSILSAQDALDQALACMQSEQP